MYGALNAPLFSHINTSTCNIATSPSTFPRGPVVPFWFCVFPIQDGHDAALSVRRSKYEALFAFVCPRRFTVRCLKGGALRCFFLFPALCLFLSSGSELRVAIFLFLFRPVPSSRALPDFYRTLYGSPSVIRVVRQPKLINRS